MIEIWFIKDDLTKDTYPNEPLWQKMFIFGDEMQVTRAFLRTPQGTRGRYWTDDTKPMTEFNVEEGGLLAKFNHTYETWVTYAPAHTGHWSDIVISTHA